MRVILCFKPQRRAKNMKIGAYVTELSNEICLVLLFIGFFDGLTRSYFQSYQKTSLDF
jgi:hypothetical protein